MAWTKYLAEYLETSEPALKLMFGIIFSYPIFIFYRNTLTKSPPFVHHLFFTFTGMSLAYWTLGSDAVLHSSTCIFATYFILTGFGANFYSVSFLFVFNLAYLLIGYYFTETDDYDICWTMPHCVLCLRLIAVAMDIWDGTKPIESLANDQKQNRILEFPSLLELFSHCFFLGGYFIGPQFSMNKFKAFIQRNIREDLPSPLTYGCQKIFLGIAYLMLHVKGSVWIPLEFLLTKEYLEMGMIKKTIWSYLWVKIMMSKYIGAWLLSEGSMILSGIAYNGVDEKGQVLWTGGANVNVKTWELSVRLQDLIDSFNINTNKWAASYIYKRMRFMNSRYFSQSVTMIFLAAWHGLHSGYYVTFFNEFLILNFEKEFLSIASQSEMIQTILKIPYASLFNWILGKIYISLFLPQCFIPFGFLTHKKYLPVMKVNGGMMYVFFLTWPIWSIFLKKLLITKKHSN